MKCISILLIFILLNMTPAGAQVIRTIAGNGVPASVGDSGPALLSELNSPGYVATDRSGNIYISETVGHRIRKIDRSGVISTFAGTGSSGYSGDGGQATSAQISGPGVLTVDINGNVYFYDNLNLRIRRVSTAGIITTVAGNGQRGGNFGAGNGGQALSAQFGDVRGLAVDAAGNIYTADNLTDELRKITVATGIVSHYAGTVPLTNGPLGDGGPAANATILSPCGISFDGSWNMLVCDVGHHTVRRITPAGIISTIAGTTNLSGYSGDGGLATAATFNGFILAAIADVSGNIYISDYSNNRIRKINTAGIISTVAGNGNVGFDGDGWGPTCATINPWDLALLPQGDLLIAEPNNQRVRRIFRDSIPPAQPGAISGNRGFCPGERVTYTVAPTPGIANYQWSLPRGWTGYSVTNTITATTGLNGGYVAVAYGVPCPYSLPQSRLSVTPATVVPAVSIATTFNGLCVDAGVGSVFEAFPVNAGSSPNYVWLKNGQQVGGNATIYQELSPAAGDIISLEMTSSASCALPPTVISNEIIMEKAPSVVPGINVNTRPNATICAGEPLTFLTNIVNGGRHPLYQWYKNGIEINGAVGSTYTDWNLNHQDTVFVKLTSSEACPEPRTLPSNQMGVNVQDPVVPSLSIAASPSNQIGNGQTVLFTATITGGGAHPELKWYKNGRVILGATDSTYTSSLLRNGDEISAELTSTALCAMPRTVAADPITLQVGLGIGAPGGGVSPLLLYPNPNTGTFTLAVNGVRPNGQMAVEVLNTMGQVVYQTDLSQGKLEVVLPEALANGHYYLKAVSADHQAVVPFSISR